MKREFIYIVIIVALSVMFLNQLLKNSDKDSSYSHNLKVLNDSLVYSKNKLGQEVANKLAFKGTNEELKKIIDLKETENSQLQISLLKWKQLASVTKVVTETKLDTVYIPFNEPVPFEFSRSFQKVDQWYSIFGLVNQEGVSINNISIPNTQTIVSGKKKISFLKTEYRFEITNSNPNIKNLEADVYNFVERNKRFSLGVSFGYNPFSNSFFIGPSIHYSLIRF